MAKIFISHSSKNNTQAIAIKNWLETQGWKDEIFLDIDPRTGLKTGRKWAEELEEKNKNSEVLLLLISNHWLQSDECKDEASIGKAKGKVLLPVIIQPGLEISDIKNRTVLERQVVNITQGGDREIFTIHLPGSETQIEKSFFKEPLYDLAYSIAKYVEPTHFDWDSSSPPFHGLSAMAEEDAAVFFGRSGEIGVALEKIKRLSDKKYSHLFVILGASGSGKSSFMSAGLLPRLKRDKKNFTVLETIRPEGNVFKGKHGLVESFTNSNNILNTTQRSKKFFTDLLLPQDKEVNPKEIVKALKNHFIRKFENDDNQPTIILPIDQAEELSIDTNGKDFFKVLDAILEDNQLKVIIMITIRSDSYQLIQDAISFPSDEEIYDFSPMPIGNFERVINGPLEVANKVSDTKVIFSADLVDNLLREIEQGENKDILPLLAFTLEKLYDENKISDGQTEIKLSDYEDFGEIGGAIDKAFKEVLKSAKNRADIPGGEKEHEDLIRKAFIPHLVRIDSETGDALRQIAKLEDLPPDAIPLLDLLVNQRLLVKDVNNKHKEEITYEISHEALLRQWPLLAGWISEDRENLIILENLKKDARDWEANGKTNEYLTFKGERLKKIIEIQDKRDDLAKDLKKESEPFKAFITAAQEEEERKERNSKLRRGSFAVAFIAVLGFGVFAYFQWKNIQEQNAILLAKNSYELVENGFTDEALLSLIYASDVFGVETPDSVLIAFDNALQRATYEKILPVQKYNNKEEVKRIQATRKEIIFFRDPSSDSCNINTIPSPLVKLYHSVKSFASSNFRHVFCQTKKGVYVFLMSTLGGEASENYVLTLKNKNNEDEEKCIIREVPFGIFTATYSDDKKNFVGAIANRNNIVVLLLDFSQAAVSNTPFGEELPPGCVYTEEFEFIQEIKMPSKIQKLMFSERNDKNLELHVSLENESRILKNPLELLTYNHIMLSSDDYILDNSFDIRNQKANISEDFDVDDQDGTVFYGKKSEKSIIYTPNIEGSSIELIMLGNRRLLIFEEEPDSGYTNVAIYSIDAMDMWREESYQRIINILEDRYFFLTETMAMAGDLFKQSKLVLHNINEARNNAINALSLKCKIKKNEKAHQSKCWKEISNK